MQTDARGIAVSGCLLQRYDDMLNLGLYISKKSNPAEKNYSTIEKEVFSILYRFSLFQD